MIGPQHNTHAINPYALLHSTTCFDNNIGQLISCLLFYDVVSVWYISYNKANTSDMPQLFPQCSIASGCGFWHLWQVSVPFAFFFVFSPTFLCQKIQELLFQKDQYYCTFLQELTFSTMYKYLLWLWIVASVRYLAVFYR